MLIHTVTTTISDGRCRIAANVELETTGLKFSASGTSEHELWIDWPVEYFVPDAQDGAPFVLICLSVAMCLGERLASRDPIPQSLLLNILEAMAIYNTDFPDSSHVVELNMDTFRPTGPTDGRIGSFYSGGVDSLFNIAELLRLKKQFGVDPVTDLWLIQGMDIKLSDEKLWSEVKRNLMAPFADDKLTRCVDIRTNAREIHDRFVGWEEMGFSAILGGISKCFAPIVGTALIGSYANYRNIVPHSSSPLVDPMWSCDRQLVRHFSCRVDRIEKLQTISIEIPQLLENLRVCYLNTDGAYNCGKCEKCLRTQMQLLLCGSLEKCDRFDEPISIQALRHLRLPWRNKNRYTWDFWNDIRQSCRQAGLDDYYHAIGRQLFRNKVRRTLKRSGAVVLSVVRVFGSKSSLNR